MLPIGIIRDWSEADTGVAFGCGIVTIPPESSCAAFLLRNELMAFNPASILTSWAIRVRASDVERSMLMNEKSVFISCS